VFLCAARDNGELFLLDQRGFSSIFVDDFSFGGLKVGAF